ncbi:MAG TPA: hypothetical protein VK714_21470 [Myxococcota bacterium]|nr:hypothetical protein [Myxococcota bacterium]
MVSSPGTPLSALKIERHLHNKRLIDVQIATGVDASRISKLERGAKPFRGELEKLEGYYRRLRRARVAATTPAERVPA